MKCAFLQAHRDEWRVTTLCRVLGVSRARYYQWVQRPVNRYAAADAQLAPQVRATFLALHRRCGSPRVHRELRAQGTRVGKKRVERLMRQDGLRAKRPRPFRVTTQSAHAHPVAPNRLQRQFAVPALNQVWGADITYLPTAEGWLYLAVVLDLCSRRVIGWALSERLTQPLTLQALEMALALRGPCPRVLHHSDRGSQFASGAYRQRLAKAGMVCSMSRAGDCWDNAMVESFFATLKIELDLDRIWPTRAAARSEVVQFVEGWYNRRRRHSALGYLTPIEFEARQQDRQAA